MRLTYIAEMSDMIEGDKLEDCGCDRETAEHYARRWSKTAYEQVAYVVALDGHTRVGHNVYINGQSDRIEGEY